MGSTETVPFRIVAIGPGGYLPGSRSLSTGLGTGLLTGHSDLDRRRSDANSAMKLRSALLIACLIVVPLLAMVSHKIPAATRAAVRKKLWSPIVRALSPAAVQPATAEPAAGEPTPSIDPFSKPWEQTAPSPPTAPPPTMGATQIDWTPAQGGDGLHRCSCRIPAEPTGQLHRVFQAAAADPLVALDNLFGQVSAWSMRSEGAAEGGMAAGAPMPRR